MKRAEYENKLNNLQNPYHRWIQEHEVQAYVTDPEARNNAEKSAFSGLSDQMACFEENYEVFLMPGAKVSELAHLMIKKHLKDLSFEELPDFIYGDEDVLDESGRHDPWFKPDWSPDALDYIYYPGSLTLVKRTISERVQEEPPAFQKGSKEFLRQCALKAESHLHIAEILSHTGENADYVFAGDKNSADEAGLTGFDPKITAVILSKDHPDLLETCVSSIRRSAEQEKVRLDIVVIDNGSSESNKQQYLALSEKYGYSYEHCESPFVYSALCNRGAAKAKDAEFLLFLNDDVEAPEGTAFLRQMASYAERKHVGAVGCKLLYPGGERIQHCGITLLRTGASHKLAGYTDDRDYYHGVNRGVHNCFAVTGACLMVTKEKFDRIHGFDEGLAIAYTDVDLCAGLLSEGLYNVCLSDVHLIHHESLSRKSDEINEGAFKRLASERAFFEEKYAAIIRNGDPWYSVNLTDTGLDYRVNVPDPEEECQIIDEDALRGCDGSEITADTFMKLREKPGKIMYSLESFRFCRSDACARENYYEIRGWAFCPGAPGYEYDPWILVRMEDGEHVFPAVRLLRTDVPQVFSKEKGLSLSGFILMIDKALLPNGDRTEIQIGLVKKGFFGGYKGCRTGWITAQEVN